MVSGNTAPDRTARIVSLLAMVVALAGGLWLFNPASRDTEAAAVVATGCSGFAADAKTMFDKGDSVMLSGAFAPGDHVHLAIDFKGARYGWQLTGAPASEKSEVTGSGAFTITKSTVTDTASRTTVAITLAPSSSKPRSTVFTCPSPRPHQPRSMARSADSPRWRSMSMSQRPVMARSQSTGPAARR
jgi:hypothetical protein